jgi:aminoglycoside phosphotransferase (APT) family kinase protein
MIFDGTKPVAVLDWEMVSCGSPERDVGWAIFLDKHHSEGIDTPRLPGFPSYEDTLAYYEERAGYRVKNLHYYEVFAGWRFGIIMLRIAQQVVHYQLATPEQGRELELNNTVTRQTAKLLDLRPPGASSGDFTK